MDDHWPADFGCASAAELAAGNAEKSVVALTALKRLESERGLPVHESTRDHVRRALDAAGVLFVESDRGRAVMQLNEAPAPPVRKGSRVRD